jgi:hypothetical protein
MPTPQSLTVDPIVPLTLLETVREVDRPDAEAEAEYVPEMLNKRLGMTDTVSAQIRRYNEAVQRGKSVARDEVSALARLVGRRPDAPQLFEAVGEATARAIYQRMSGLRKGAFNVLPKLVAHPLARYRARKIEARYFGPALTRDFGQALAEAYHDAGMRELRRLLSLT